MEPVMTPLIFVTIFLGSHFSGVYSSAGNEWSYIGKTGPDNWHLNFSHCGGVKQSPIDIVTKDVTVNPEQLVPFNFTNYDIAHNVNMSLTNNGHTVQVDLNDKSIEISGAGLPGHFIAQQFHFHWGKEDSRGSEHTINNEHFPMEMHIVHYNRKYNDLQQAMDKDDGLAVLGFLFVVGKHNDHFDEIIKRFGGITHADEHVEFPAIPLKDFIPAKLDTYYRYEGSLTTPPCYESVSWTLFHEKIEIAEEQLDQFRTKIYENHSGAGRDIQVIDDYRPLQRLNSRSVFASDASLKYHPYTNRAKTIQISLFLGMIYCFICSYLICDS